MKKKLVLFTLFFAAIALGQTKVGGKVVDKKGESIPFASVFFKDSREGVITDENGIFYFESEQNYTALVVLFEGYEKREIPLKPGLNQNLKITLKTTSTTTKIHIRLY